MKKKTILIVLLSIIMVVCLFTACSNAGGSENGGDSEDSTPTVTYTNISTMEDLQNLAGQSGDYKLVNDIDISGSEWMPISDFSGLLEGDSYSIVGLTISGNNSNVGLFSTLKGTVQNLKVTSVNITGTGDAGTAGGLCGTNEGTINNVTVSGTINTPYYNNVGGICGNNNSGKIDSSVNLVDVTGYNYVGGIAGYYTIAKGATCDGNSNHGIINGVSCVGGMAGQLQCSQPGTSSSGSATFTNNENLYSVNGNGDYVGGLIGYQSSNSYNDWGTYYYTYLTISSCSNSAVVNGESYTGGLVGYADKLTSITSSTNSADITGENFVGGYVGKSSGTSIKIATNNNTITGKGYIGGIAGYCGDLTDCTNNGTITSISVIVEDSSSKAVVGGVAGYATSINNCTNNSDIIVETGGSFVGGIVGFLYVSKGTTCNKNSNNGEIKGTDCVGGIAGQLKCAGPGTSSSGSATFSNNENIKSVSGSGNYVGGLIGYQNSNSYNDWGTYYYTYLTISDCKNSAVINGDDYTGGIVGYAERLTGITSSTNTADITGGNYVGGYVGKSSGTSIKIATNNYTITGKGYVGGIAGYCGDLTNCTNNGSIVSISVIVEDSSSRAYVGGIAGYATAINNCTNNADITIETGGSFVGGIVGYLFVSKGTTCNKNSNNGEIEGTDYVGGIVGALKCAGPGTSSSGSVSFTNNENLKSICGSGNYVGGLIGYQISNSYNDWGTYYYTYLTISNCKNEGNVEGNNYVGGIIAYGAYMVTTAAVWDSNTNNGTITGNDNYGSKYGYIK